MPYYKFPDRDDIPYGYCHCGCGGKTNLARQSDTRLGRIKGEPIRFISGHQTRAHSRADIFWQHVTSGAPGECWLFRGSKFRHGYGQLKYMRRKLFAHRVSYEIHKGDIPEGLFVLHACDTPACCNPNHLFLGTQADNNRDMYEKGRHCKGESVRHSKLTEADVIEMRELRDAGLKVCDIAARFNVSHGHVSDITNRKKWVHLP